MKLAICTIQRDRAPWVAEWVAFHYLVGFRKFIFFAHRCVDATHHTLQRLQKVFDIQAFIIGDDLDRPQLHAYQHAYRHFGADVDWMAFVDGDEFLFPSTDESMESALAGYEHRHLSALGVYWLCFGSGGHVTEPPGLITENYTKRAPDDFPPNHHVKSIVRGGLGDAVHVSENSHVFVTPQGTFDELLRPITKGCMAELQPSYSRLRINHYVCQSHDFFKKFKQHSGAPDAGKNMVRPDSWWLEHDRNDVVDSTIARFIPPMKALLKEALRP